MCVVCCTKCSLGVRQIFVVVLHHLQVAGDIWRHCAGGGAPE